MLLWHVLVPAVPIPRTPVTRSRLAGLLCSPLSFLSAWETPPSATSDDRVVAGSYIELVVSDGEHAHTPSPMYVQHIYY
jgi:hypothetical protein